MNKIRIATFSLAMLLSCGVQGLGAETGGRKAEIKKLLAGFNPSKTGELGAIGEFALRRRKSFLKALLDQGSSAVIEGDISVENYKMLKDVVQPIFDSKQAQARKKEIATVVGAVGVTAGTLFAAYRLWDYLKNSQAAPLPVDPSWYAKLGTKENLLIAGSAVVALGGLYALWRNRPVSNEVEAAL